VAHGSRGGVRHPGCDVLPGSDRAGCGEVDAVRVLVACEFSGVVRDAFLDAGHQALSVDLEPSESDRGKHWQADVFAAIDRLYELGQPPDALLAFPPCTHLAVSGARWFKDKQQEQAEALAFVQALMDAPIERIAIENPISVISSRIRKPDQIIQPWMFGHGETKATCLWLKNLPKLEPTEIVEGRTPRVHHASPGPDRWKERSRTLPGIAAAMAEQWGSL
jgi:site-specific DNA-cytosine methylase